ncbi:hypothetical protein E0L36_20610 [Streptomyces sp. AJS327]|uniref:outer membrane protein assembly factor BamB family protein n=1 Tax=Streptomyces sp. AJS327 TaxID=2545265 RepID=UPI0015DFC7D6|nr:PQQ-binding-like beta-propeller repeat protein [Streptomyces sp. AJS327]MBA0053187.1 hypothetical protein [Streptomyces sp. AJS327]
MGRARTMPSLLAVLAMTAAAGCGADTGEDTRSEGEWRPWQTTFKAGEDERGAERYACDADMPRSGLLRCSGRGFDSEALRSHDGAPRKTTRPSADAEDFGKSDGLLLRHVYGRAEIRAVDAESGKTRWKHTASRAPAVHTSDGAVSVEWKRPDGERTPVDDAGPGGDLIVREPASGEESARIPTPKDRWCFPLAPFGPEGDTIAACEDLQRDGQLDLAQDEPLVGKFTVHRVDAEKEKLTELEKLEPEKSDEREYEPVYLGGDDGDLLFLLRDGEWSYGEEYDEEPRALGDAKYGDLLRVDAKSGKQHRVSAVDDVPRGSYPSLSGGRLTFLSPDTRTTVAADPATGKHLWTAKSPFQRNSVPVVSPSQGEVYTVDARGRLLARDLKNGEELRRSETTRTKGSPGGPLELPSLNVVDGSLMVTAGNTVFSVSPKDLDAKPDSRHTVNRT